jgi:hypothetical protein
MVPPVVPVSPVVPLSPKISDGLLVYFYLFAFFLFLYANWLLIDKGLPRIDEVDPIEFIPKFFYNSL